MLLIFIVSAVLCSDEVYWDYWA